MEWCPVDKIVVCRKWSRYIYDSGDSKFYLYIMYSGGSFLSFSISSSKHKLWKNTHLCSKYVIVQSWHGTPLWKNVLCPGSWSDVEQEPEMELKTLAVTGARLYPLHHHDGIYNQSPSWGQGHDGPRYSSGADSWTLTSQQIHVLMTAFGTSYLLANRQ
jgi:hypothetical protein